MSICVETDKIQCGAISKTARIIAVDEKSGKLAVIRKLRTQGSHDYIEFYNILNGWLATPELVICPDNGSIEHAMFVANGELMTSHANGSICFVDPHDNRRVKRMQIAASTIWAACDHPVAGSEEKSRVALISHSSILYFFDTINKLIISSISLGVDTRLFDVSSNGELVAIGSIDGIMITGEGKVQRRLIIDRENRRDPTIAWSVVFYKNDVLACGDSRGSVTLWNPSSGALIQSISVLQSHILTMCIVNGKLNVAGVDPRISEIAQLGNGEYDVVSRKNGPIRDVRCLVPYEKMVLASGEDFEIFVGRDGCRQLLMQLDRNVKIGGEILASNGENFVDIWWRKSGEDEPVEGSNILPQHHKSVFLAKVYAPKQSPITCWSISECGKYLAIGTAHDVSTYEIVPESKKKKSMIMKMAVYTDVIATAVVVTSGKDLFVSVGDFALRKYSAHNSNKKPMNIMDQYGCGSVTKMSISNCGKMMGVITSRAQVFIVNVANGESRLAKVELPIDVICNSQTAYILSTYPIFEKMSESKKVLYEVATSSGVVKRSTTPVVLRMKPTSPKSIVPGLPVSMVRVDGEKFVVASYDGQWSIVDTENDSIYSISDGPIKAKKAGKREARNEVPRFVIGVKRVIEEGQEENEKERETRTIRIRRNSSGKDTIKSIKSRILVLKVEEDEEPKTKGFKLKKFGMQ